MNASRLLLALVLFSTAAWASAATITVTASGSVTEVWTPDAFGTQVGDAIDLHAVFDSSAIVDAGPSFGIPGLQFASLADPSASLSITLGSRSWTQFDEPFYGADLGFFPTPLPHVVLLDGNFIGLDYFGIGPGDDVLISDAIGQLFFGDPLGMILGGNSDPTSPPFWIGQWDLAGARVAVPEPGTLALLIAGCLACLCVARRQLPRSARSRSG